MPLTGQYKQMLLKDIDIVKQEIITHIPEGRRNVVFGKAAALFSKDKDA